MNTTADGCELDGLSASLRLRRHWFVLHAQPPVHDRNPFHPQRRLADAIDALAFLPQVPMPVSSADRCRS
jgi:hypothetical protein